MPTFAFVAPPFLGHLNPNAALARSLAARGSRAVFLASPDAAARIRGMGLDAVAVGGAGQGPDLAAVERRMARPGGPWGIRATVRDMAESTDGLCRHAPDALRELAPAALVCDQLEPAGGLLARRLGLPLVSVANALPINEEPDVPPPYVGWPYDPTDAGRRRNRGGRRVSAWLMKPLHDVIAGWADAWRLGRLRSVEDCLSPTAQVAQCVRGLDFPRRALPPGFAYAGPFRSGVEDGPPLGPDADGRPLVYCSLGTLQGSRVGLFREVAAACDALDLRLVIAHGGRLSDEQVAGLPGRPTAMAYAPQRAILSRAALAVCHAGFNTALDALSFGVPLAVTPLGFEQPGTGARLERIGAGIVVRRRWGRFPVRDAIERLLGDQGPRERARSVAAEIAQAGGVELACDIVEGAAAAAS
ncbi:nucleotide disphospho-sugar-binding domain-containing protein [Alsobacter sp. SYSU BS001988]